MTNHNIRQTLLIFAALLLILIVSGCALIGTNPEINRAVDQIVAPTSEARDNAESTLLRLGSDSIPALLRTIQTAPPRKRGKAISILAQIKDEKVCEEFERLLIKSKLELSFVDREIMVNTLGKNGGKKYLPLFKSMMLTEPHEKVKCTLASQLSRLGDESGTEYLTEYWLNELETATHKKQAIDAIKALEELHGQGFGRDAEQWREWLKKK
ncbi:HEAT repeat domain-containing protein [Verrucomicrobiota bacterium]